MANQGITFTVNAETGGAAGQLTEFFAAANTQMASVGKSGEVASASLRQLRETSMLARDGFQGLEGTLLLVGGTHFPMLATGVMTARSALLTLRSAAILTGASLATLLLPITLIGGAVAAGALLWRSYGSETKAAADAQKEEMESLSKLPALLGQVNTLMQSRRMSAAAANEYADYLTGQKKLYRLPSGEITPQATQEVPGERGHWEGGGIPGAPPAWTPPTGPSQAPLPEATGKERQDWVTKQLAGEQGLGDARLESVVKLKELEDQTRAASFDGLRKEEEEIHRRYEQEREEITKTMGQSAGALSPKERKAGEAALEQSKGNEAAAIEAARFKDQQEQMAAAEAAFTQRKSELSKEAAEQRAELERGLTLVAAQEGDKRTGAYEREFQARVKLEQGLLYSGETSEREYTAAVQEATIKRLEGTRQEAQERVRESEAQMEIEAGADPGSAAAGGERRG